jgi:uncharacterized protein (DUF58 family)
VTKDRVRRKKKKRRRRGFRLTREGKVFLAVCLGVGLAAVNTGNNLLYLVLGLMLSLLLVSGTLSDLVLWRISVARHLPKRLFAGVPMAVEIELHNRKKRAPSYALEVVDLAIGETDAPRRCFFLKVSASAKQRATYRRVPTERGWLRFDEIRLASRHPFGLIEKRRHRRCKDEALVYPALVPVVLSEIPGIGHGRDEVIDEPGRGADVRGLRDFREGDEARAIHWRRSAALDRFVVRERSREGRGRLTLRLDQLRPEDAGDGWTEAFERRISRAASLANEALAAGFAVEVVVRGGRSPTVLGGGPPDPIFRYLALLEPAAADAGDFPLPPRSALVYEVTDVPIAEAAE